MGSHWGPTYNALELPPMQVFSLRTGHLRHDVQLCRSYVQGGLQYRGDGEQKHELGSREAGGRNLPGLRICLCSIQLHLLLAVSPVNE